MRKGKKNNLNNVQEQNVRSKDILITRSFIYFLCHFE